MPTTKRGWYIAGKTAVKGVSVHNGSLGVGQLRRATNSENALCQYLSFVQHFAASGDRENSQEMQAEHSRESEVLASRTSDLTRALGYVLPQLSFDRVATPHRHLLGVLQTKHA